MTAILGSIQNARKTKAAWTLQNPILLNGQIVGELDSGKVRFKQGDGVTAYTSLPYASVSDADIEAYVDPLYYKKSVVDGMFSDAVKAPVAIDCSTNPNYPAASKGTSYKVSVAGKIGGGSGVNVGVGDLMIASVTTAAGTHAAVGANWGIYETNIDKATEAVFGTARRATSAELTAGADDVAFVTSAKLRAAGDARYPQKTDALTKVTPIFTGVMSGGSIDLGTGGLRNAKLGISGSVTQNPFYHSNFSFGSGSGTSFVFNLSAYANNLGIPGNAVAVNLQFITWISGSSCGHYQYSIVSNGTSASVIHIASNPLGSPGTITVSASRTLSELAITISGTVAFQCQGYGVALAD